MTLTLGHVGFAGVDVQFLESFDVRSKRTTYEKLVSKLVRNSAKTLLMYTLVSGRRRYHMQQPTSAQRTNSTTFLDFLETWRELVSTICSSYYKRVRGYRKYCRSEKFDIDRGRERPRSLSGFRGATIFCDILDPECNNSLIHRLECIGIGRAIAEQ
jgi:hypothetical protein